MLQKSNFICSNRDFRTFYVGHALAYITVYAFAGFCFIPLLHILHENLGMCLTVDGLG